MFSINVLTHLIQPYRLTGKKSFSPYVGQFSFGCFSLNEISPFNTTARIMIGTYFSIILH